MPKFDIFNANIIVDDVELTEYNVVTDNEKKTVTCWIQSEAGKAFSARWSYSSPYPCSSAGYVYVDGTFPRGNIVNANQLARKTVSAARVTSTTARSLMFSGIELTDDDAFLHSGNMKDLGDIRVDIWKVHAEGDDSFFRKSGKSQRDSNSKVHEKVKKGMTHRVNFGEEKSIPANTTFHKTVNILKLATFIFKYRSIDILRADGIAPPLPNKTALPSGAGKRSADALEAETPEEEEDVDDEIEERAEAEFKKLLEKANEIQSMLAKRAGKMKAPSTKRVKTEGHPIILSNEIIDLT